MNNKHMLDLTLRLSQALDQNYDVVNMETVLSVISALEGATITKEQLEATRLAKYINQLRRRTKSEQLARRAKSLLKKWREMVGIQQTNETASSSNTPTTISHRHRSQPTSPIVGKSIESNTNATEKLSPGDFLRSTASNPATNLSSTGSASINAINNKKLAVGPVINISTVPMPSVPASSGNINTVQLSTIDSVKQPTSFANLITSMNNDAPGGTGSTGDFTSSPNSRKINKRKDRNAAHIVAGSKSLALDQSSSSNAEFNRISTIRNPMPITNVAPIVIDIQDSNSGSNVISGMPSSTSLIAIGNTDSSNSKTKKSKKEKKRKEREQQTQGSTSLPSVHLNVSNVIDESCSSQQRASADPEYDKFVPIVDDRSRITYPITGISEILSLSNSSLSSMFPISNATSIPAGVSATIDQNKTETSVGSNSGRTLSKTLSVSDLTFAGKFNSSGGTSDLFGFNGTGGNFDRVETAYVNSSADTLTFPKASSANSFVPFSGSGCNSNDSTSNSRTSQFDIIDVVNQDISQSKIIDELRQQQKKQTVKDTTTSTQQQQNVITTCTTGNILMPPAVTTQTRISNTIGDSMNIPCESEQKIPKKRGRKKGSKGVDSIIAKETSLTSQMLLTTLGGKKVKTTKELYTEMQNRKLGVSSSPTLSNWLAHQQFAHISRPNSSCSEPSLHSPRTSDACSTNVSTIATRSTPDKTVGNAGLQEDEIDESDSESNTSDPSRDSTTAQRHLQRRQSSDSNSNSHLVPKVSDINSAAAQPYMSISADVLEKQIKQFLSQLPPVPPIDQIEWECLEDTVQCTCKIIEIEPSTEQIASQQLSLDSKKDIQSENFEKKINEDAAQLLNMPINMLKEEVVTNSQPMLTKPVLKSTEPVPQPPPQRPKKSIFDLDFDDEEDPLHKFVAEAAAKQEQQDEINEVQSELVEESFELNNMAVEILPDQAIQKSTIVADQTILQEPPPMLFPTYEVEEDLKCVAKERYEMQTQKITKFHITALHNCYIPNVNGNWDNAETTPITPSISLMTKLDCKIIEKSKNNDLSNDTLWQNVVPKYGSLVNEYIPKDLSHVPFTPNFNQRKRSSFEKRQYFVPFLGVARKNLKLQKSKFEIDGILKNNGVKNCQEINLIKRELQANNKYVDKFDRGLTSTDEKQEIKPETNNNDDNNVFVTNEVNTKLESSQLKLNDGEKRTKNECRFNDNNIKLIYTQDNASSLSLVDSHQIKNQPVISSDITCNKLFGRITIDITDEHGVESADVPTTHYNDVATTNLLTIVKLSGNTVEPKQSENTASYQSYENQNDQNINNNSAPIFTIAAPVANIAEDKSVSTSMLIKNVDSRRSSTCSNSSLKQTQHSINLKLRRRRLQKQECYNMLAPHQKYGKKRRKKLKSTEVFSEEKIQRVVKRIKIAINGDIATQRQVSIGSNNSTDEEDDDEDDVYNSTGSRSSPYDKDLDEYNVVNDEGEAEEYMDDDDDEEEEDEEDYGGDYHEVVTRDISATSTGNNHIVLTIKKTPSKTNSPSSSLSAISPNVTTSLSQRSVAKKTNCISKAIECVNENITSNSNTEVVPLNVLNSNYVVSNLEEIMALNDHLEVKNISATAKITKNGAEENISKNTAIEIPTSSKRLVRKLSKKCSSKGSKNSRKLHQQLFFPYELRTNDFEDCILNLSSCSSSCGEVYEYDETENMTEDYNQDNSTTSLDNQLPFINNPIETISNSSTKFDATCTSDRFELDSLSSDSDSEINDDTSSRTEHNNKKKMENANMIENQNDQESNDVSLQFANNLIDRNHITSEEDLKEELPLENNGLLKSFNNIYVTHDHVKQNQRMALKLHSDDEDLIEGAADNEAEDVVVIDDCEQQKQQLQQQLPNENCDVYSNFYNNNNNSKLDNSNSCIKTMVRSSSNNNGSNSKNIAATAKNEENSNTQKNALTKASSSNHKLIPHKEYRTGLRAVDEDVDDDDGNNCARIQQFKEWHQVLQLRSYNDELLTVLPYVVLE